MNKVRVYIDGFNLYHAIDKIDNYKLKWINIWKLCESFLMTGECLDRVYFFTAVWPYDHEKQLRHRNYIAALKATNVTIVEGKFKKSNRVCYTQSRSCAFREEKQTDVAIGIQMVRDAISGEVHRQILITADSDQIPTAKMLAEIGSVATTLFFPPGRAHDARHLGDHFVDRKEITPGRLLTCELPRSVRDLNGKVVATMPAIYSPPA